MRRGSLRFSLMVSGFVLLGACSNIIGISSYEIDPALDEAEGGNGAGNEGGGSAGKSVVPEGGSTDPGTGGKADAGDTSRAGDTSSAGGAGSAGDTGGAGAPPQAGCQTAQDCDDTIDCTTDKCGADGECVHTPSNAACDATQCETCEAGIGCVAGPKTQMQLLADPGFDLNSGDWDESDSDDANLVALSGAQSGTRVAQFGPAAPTAIEQQYSDLLQWVTIPAGTVALSLSGYYKLTPGTDTPADDYVVAAFYAAGELKPVTQFHSFEATSGAQSTWKAFSYSATKSDVLDMAGNEYTFDLVGHVWDSVYYFDSLQLNATVCQ